MRLGKLTFIVSALTLLAGEATFAQSAAWTPEMMLQVKRVAAARPSPDGNRVVFTVASPNMRSDTSEWTSQVWIADADGTNALQLTRGSKSASAPDWSPDGKWIAFLSGRGGSNQVYRMLLSGGEAEQVTDQKGGVSSFRWSPDGKWIAYTAADAKSEEEEKEAKEKRDAWVVDEDYKRARLYVVPAQPDGDAKRTARRLNTADVHITGFNWSPNSNAIVYVHATTPVVFENTDISAIDVASGTVTRVAASRAQETSPHYSRDGRSIAYVASDDPPTWAFTSHVYVVPVGGSNARQLYKTFDEQPSLLGWSPDNKRVYFTETHGTVGRLATVPVDGGVPQLVSNLDFNVTGATLNATATAVGLISQWSDKPPEAFVSKLDTFLPRQVSRVQEPPAAPLGRTQALRWKSDGSEIEGLLTYPVGYRRGERVPLLVIVHGGPTGVFTQSYIATPGPYPIAAFASRGYAVLRVNPRGSSGYGREFRYANYRDWGGGDYRDIMNGVNHVIELGIADSTRLGIMGWSYGGYMTSWVITQTKRFKAASVGAGVTNLMSFTGTADIPGFIPDYMGGEYWDNLDTWRTKSAMFNIKGATTPTLIQHGERDIRVPISQGYELYNALKRQNVPVKMVVYPRQPHGLQEPKLVLDAMHRNLDWFERWILRGGKVATR
jgi:dipeptidyl aminopeptidase/acylaminoacyl peptidase